MAVIAQPQRISGIVFENKVTEKRVKLAESQSLMTRIANFLYPAWAVQLAEDLRETYRK